MMRPTRKDLEGWQENPALFVSEAFGVKLEDYQARALTALAKNERARVIVRSCHGAGKTTLDALAIVWFLICWGPSKVITTAPTWRQVEKILWAELRSWLNRATKRGICFGGEIFQTEWRHDDDWFALGLSTNEPSSFEGWHSDRILFILDEAKGLPRWVFDSVEGLLGTGDQLKMLVTSTPGVIGTPYHECFTKERWAKFKVDWSQVKRNGGLARWAKERGEDWGVSSKVYRAKCLAEFYEDEADCLVPLDWIERARQGIDEPYKHEPVIIGVDVARHGDDESVLTVRQGARVHCIKALVGQDTVEVAGQAAALANKYHAQEVAVDAIGLGAGVFDILKRQGYRAREYKASWKARNRERFKILRDESHWALRERFKEGLIDLSKLPKEAYDKLVGQLHRVKFHIDEIGRVRIETKDEYRRRSIRLLGEDNARSPDYVDSLNIAFSSAIRLVFDYTSEFAAIKRKERIAV